MITRHIDSDPVLMAKLFPAYQGAEPYLFVSYSHRDLDRVAVEMQRLREAGFPIWYDEGITVGGSWGDELARRITDCALFVIFITPNSAESEHCLRELNYAQSHRRKVLSVHLEETELSPGLSLALSDRQAVFRYRLGEVEYAEKLLTGVTAALGEPLASKTPTPPPSTPRSFRRLFAAGALIVLLAAVAVWQLQPDGDLAPTVISRSPEPTHPLIQAVPKESPAIAVLPFVNMSSDPDNEYFSHGISEEILDALVQTNTIPVIARTSSFQFRDRTVSIEDIAAVLNVSHVLEGSVRRSGDQVRITAQLIDTASGTHLWSGSFDRELTDVFRVQDEIAKVIVTEIEAQLGEEVPWEYSKLKQRGMTLRAQNDANPVAYDLYLRAVYEIAEGGTLQQVDRALDLMKQSVAIDPENTAGWLGVAVIHSLYRAVKRPAEIADLQRPALERALQLNPDDPAALSLMGALRSSYDLEWKEGEAMLRKAVALAPTYPGSLTRLGTLLKLTNRGEEAIAVYAAAHRLDPYDPYNAAFYAEQLVMMGRNQDALEVLDGIDAKGASAPLFAYEIGNLFYRIAQSAIGIEPLYSRLLESGAYWTNVAAATLGEEAGDVLVMRWRDATARNDLLRVRQLNERIVQLLESDVYFRSSTWQPPEEYGPLWLETLVRNRDPGAHLALLWNDFLPDSFRERLNHDELGEAAIHHPRALSASEISQLEARRMDVPREVLARYVGDYVNVAGHVHQFYLEGGDLMVYVPNDGFRAPMLPLSETHFHNPWYKGWEYLFESDGQGGFEFVQLASQFRRPNRRVYPVEVKILRRHEGSFLDDNGVTLDFEVNEGWLTMNSPFGQTQLVPWEANQFKLMHTPGALIVFDESLDSFQMRGVIQDSVFHRQ